MNKKIGLATPTMHGEELKYIHEAFERNWIAPLGFNCDAFEEEIVSVLQSEEPLYGFEEDPPVKAGCS